MADEDAAGPVTGDFGFAFSWLKAGARVRKVTWRGTDEFLIFVKGSDFSVDRLPLLEVYPAGTLVKYRPHIDHHKGGTLGPVWFSTSDLLDEWEAIPGDEAPVSSLEEKEAAAALPIVGAGTS